MCGSNFNQSNKADRRAADQFVCQLLRSHNRRVCWPIATLALRTTKNYFSKETMNQIMIILLLYTWLVNQIQRSWTCCFNSSQYYISLAKLLDTFKIRFYELVYNWRREKVSSVGVSWLDRQLLAHLTGVLLLLLMMFTETTADSPQVEVWKPCDACQNQTWSQFSAYF